LYIDLVEQSEYDPEAFSKLLAIEVANLEKQSAAKQMAVIWVIVVVVSIVLIKVAWVTLFG